MNLCWEATGGAPESCVRGPLTPTYILLELRRILISLIIYKPSTLIISPQTLARNWELAHHYFVCPSVQFPFSPFQRALRMLVESCLGSLFFHFSFRGRTFLFREEGRVTSTEWSGTEWARVEWNHSGIEGIDNKVGNNLGLSSCAVPRSTVACVVAYFRRTELLTGVSERSGID